MKRATTLLIIVLLLQTNFGVSQSTAVITEVRSTIQSLVEELDIVGLAVTISYQDSIILSEGFGFRDLNGETSIDPATTLFRIASISKPITTTILGRLYEEEIIDLESSAYTYVPNFPKKEFDFNLLHLASHRSGIRHYKALERENRKPLSIEEGLEKFQKSKLKFKPGTEYLYSSYGFNLLGVAMEKGSGESFEELMKSYVTMPLGMKNTIPDYGHYEGIETSGFFVMKGRQKVKEAKSAYLAVKLPSGGMLSTSEDLVKFGNAYVFKRILKEDTQRKMLTEFTLPNNKKTGYGIGWGLKVDEKGRNIISHTGGNIGSVCRLIIYPESQLTIAVVSNTFGIDYLKFLKTVNNIPNIILEDLELD